MVREQGDETVLTGVVADQAALHGVIERLERTGAHLVEVRQRPAVVEIRVTGAVGDLSMAAFDGFTSVVEPVSTTLRGPVRNEAELAEVVRRVRDAGLDLVSVRVTEGGLTGDAADAAREDLRQ
jgi:hypothetical protein